MSMAVETAKQRQARRSSAARRARSRVCRRWDMDGPLRRIAVECVGRRVIQAERTAQTAARRWGRAGVRAW